jgi:hypothetical protein
VPIAAVNQLDEHEDRTGEHQREPAALYRTGTIEYAYRVAALASEVPANRDRLPVRQSRRAWFPQLP